MESLGINSTQLLLQTTCSSSCCSSRDGGVGLVVPRRAYHSLKRGLSSCCGSGREEQLQGGENRVFIFGLGYVGLALARFLSLQGWSVYGTCSRKSKLEALVQEGLSAFCFNSRVNEERLDDAGLKALYESTHLVNTIPPVEDGNDPVLSVYERQIIDMLGSKSHCWLGYLSSTGVYGDWQGAWVDEESIPKPCEKRVIARLNAEMAWLQLGEDPRASAQVFRLGGIYGPGRSAIDTLLCLDKRQSQRQQGRERKRFTSRVHVADICQVVWASMNLPSKGKVYNVVDNDPAPRTEVFAFAKDLINERWPEFPLRNEEQPLPAKEEDTASNSSEKRVMNKRIREELKVELLFPSYKSGLKSIIEGYESTNSQHLSNRFLPS